MDGWMDGHGHPFHSLDTHTRTHAHTHTHTQALSRNAARMEAVPASAARPNAPPLEPRLKGNKAPRRCTCQQQQRAPWWGRLGPLAPLVPLAPPASPVSPAIASICVRLFPNFFFGPSLFSSSHHTPARVHVLWLPRTATRPPFRSLFSAQHPSIVHNFSPAGHSLPELILCTTGFSQPCLPGCISPVAPGTDRTTWAIFLSFRVIRYSSVEWLYEPWCHHRLATHHLATHPWQLEMAAGEPVSSVCVGVGVGVIPFGPWAVASPNT